MLHGFDRMFDFDRDGVLDRGERAMEFQYFDEMSRRDEVEDAEDILDELEFMDEDERREVLEDLGYDEDDFDDF